jgi:hypothetical protein
MNVLTTDLVGRDRDLELFITWAIGRQWSMLERCHLYVPCGVVSSIPQG